MVLQRLIEVIYVNYRVMSATIKTWYVATVII
jgi:hypothetical protein